ncbi:MAG: hypothetical protein HQK99_06565 [Nitrospirae bacterium]|nr:hypothetical protein [Nitrospirota bacterium]
MEKEEIIREIQRVASENNGKSPGINTFKKLTGISRDDWRGKYWRNWNDALKEADLEENALQKAYDNDSIIRSIILLTRKYNRYPTLADIKLEKRINKSFPGQKPVNRLGTAKNVLNSLENMQK